MRTTGWREFVLSLVVVLSGFAANGWARPQEPPDDDTASVPTIREESEEKNGEAEQDDPTARLLWQRKAWGVVSSTFRQSAIQEGKKHGSKKNAKGPKWVSIGPAGRINGPL